MQRKSKIIQKRIYNIEENGGKPQNIYIRTYYKLIGAKKKMEQKYYYGNAISEYGMQNGYVDYATLSKCFDAVLNNDIMSLTYDIGYWEQVSGIIDNTDDIEELEENQKDLEDDLEQVQESSKNNIIIELKKIENEIDNLNDQIEELESEQNDDQEVFQWFIVDDLGARLLQQEANEIVYYNETLDMYLWGVTHYGTSWSYVLTSIAIDW